MGADAKRSYGRAAGTDAFCIVAALFFSIQERDRFVLKGQIVSDHLTYRALCHELKHAVPADDL
jgi:hypothetical protein